MQHDLYTRIIVFILLFQGLGFLFLSLFNRLRYVLVFDNTIKRVR